MNNPKFSQIPFPVRACPLWDGSSLYGSDGSTTDPLAQDGGSLIFWGPPAQGTPPASPLWGAKTRNAVGPCASGCSHSDLASALNTLFPTGSGAISANQSGLPTFSPVVGANCGAYQIKVIKPKFNRWLRVKNWNVSGTLSDGGSNIITPSGTFESDRYPFSPTEDDLIRFIELHGSLMRGGGQNNFSDNLGDGGEGGNAAWIDFAVLSAAGENNFTDYTTGSGDSAATTLYQFSWCPDIARQRLITSGSPGDPDGKNWYPSVVCRVYCTWRMSDNTTTDDGGGGPGSVTTVTQVVKWLVIFLTTDLTLEGEFTFNGGDVETTSAPDGSSGNATVPVAAFRVEVDGETLYLNGMASVITQTFVTTENIAPTPWTRTLTVTATDATVDLTFSPAGYLTYSGTFDPDSGDYTP